MALIQPSIRPALARIMSEGGASIIDWLIELGNEFPPDAIVESGVAGCPRGHQSIGGGLGIVQSLVNLAGAKGIEVALGSQVTELILQDGWVCGIAPRTPNCARKRSSSRPADSVTAREGSSGVAHCRGAWQSRVPGLRKSPIQHGRRHQAGRSCGANVTGIHRSLVRYRVRQRLGGLPSRLGDGGQSGRMSLHFGRRFLFRVRLSRDEQPQTRRLAIFDEPVWPRPAPTKAS